MRMVGRLRPGVQLDKAKQELASIAQTKILEFPRPPGSLEDGFMVNSLQADLTRAVRPALLAIIGAVILLLMIACVNVTNLLLARAVELPQAAEAAGPRDVGHRQVGVLQEAAGEVGAMAPRQLVGCGAHVLDEQPAEVADRHAEGRRGVWLARVTSDTVLTASVSLSASCLASASPRAG